MHPTARRIPPYGLASLVTFLVLALPTAACACLAGLALLVLSALVIVGGPFNGEPGEAFLGGMLGIVGAVVGTLAALLAIGALAGLLAGPVLTSIALLARLLLRALRVRSRIAAVALFVVAGHLLGLVIAGGVQLVGTRFDWIVVEEPFLLFALYVLILFVCVVATTVYGSVLIATDTAGSLARRAASSFKQATARPVA